MTDFENMTKDEAIEFCMSHRSQFIKQFDNEMKGNEQFENVVVLLTAEVISPDELPDYGMKF